jgi:hypothetical protein
MRRWLTRSAKPLVAASVTIATLMAGPRALAAPAADGPAVTEQAALTQAAEGQIAVTGAAGKCTWDVNATVGWAYAGGKVKSLVSTDSSAISIIRCPSGWSDFMFSRAQVIKNALRVGIAKTSECTRAWCTVTVSAAIWHCDDFILCAGYYSGEGSFTISLTGGHFFAPPAPPGCSLARSDEVLLCSLQTKKKYVPPEI